MSVGACPNSQNCELGHCARGGCSAHFGYEQASRNHSCETQMKPAIQYRSDGVPVCDLGEFGRLSLITQVEAAYIAGIIDGEGSISINRRKDRDGYKSGFCFRPVLSVTNTNYALVEWLACTTGVGSTPLGAKPTNARHKPSKRWQVWTRQAAAVLCVVRPYLVIKIAQADIALRYMATDYSHRGKHGLSDEQHTSQRSMYEQMKILNTRGLWA